MAVTHRSGAGARNYPPLALASLVMLVLLAVMPSALNLPQSTPSETLEYAPVPPEDQEGTPPSGNFSSLGLGSSQSLGAPAPSGDAAGDGGGEVGGQAVKTSSTKRCVGSPPRQTEDELSPPCVASFTGDNGGATYQGVTPDEVRVVVFVPWGGAYTNFGSRGDQDRPRNVCFDLAEPPSEDEHYFTQGARIWQRYFNERYQTYGRFVHVYVCYSNGDSAESRRADAAENYRKIKPFATIFVDVNAGNVLQYVQVMASKGAMNFGATEELPVRAYSAHPKLLWGYTPSIEQHARQFASWICTKVVPYPVSVGDPAKRGQPRKLSLIYTTDQSKKSMQEFAAATRAGIERCGGVIADEATFPDAGYIFRGAGESYAVENMARFQQNGITTIIWAEGHEDSQTPAATALNYFPEWIVAGDQVMDDMVLAKYQDQRQWANAWVMSNATLVPPRRQQRCYLAAREVEPDLAFWDSNIPCMMYEQFRQMFIGIQVAGPRLSPESVDKGFRAIPAIASTSSRVPACYYESGDYTCVKDATPMWWDPQARSPDSEGGCFRVPQEGKRFLPTTWPEGDIAAQRTPNDPCNGYSSGTYLDPSPGPEKPPPQ